MGFARSVDLDIPLSAPQFPASNKHPLLAQAYLYTMNFVLFDLEATCWGPEEKNLRPQETIEIAALLVSETGKLISTFESLVRPKRCPTLSDFCRRLTGISQIDLNKSDTFPEVIEDFKEWIGLYDDEDYLLCSWGEFDRELLIKDCKFHGMPHEWCLRHISLQKQHAKFKRLKKEIGLHKAITLEGWEFEGEPHRAMTDTENMAQLFYKYFKWWEYDEL